MGRIRNIIFVFLSLAMIAIASSKNWESPAFAFTSLDQFKSVPLDLELDKDIHNGDDACVTTHLVKPGSPERGIVACLKDCERKCRSSRHVHGGAKADWVRRCVRKTCLTSPDRGEINQTCVELGRCIKFDGIVRVIVTTELSDKYIKAHTIQVPMEQRKIYINNSPNSIQPAFEAEKKMIKSVRGVRPLGLENVPIVKSEFRLDLGNNFEENTLSIKLPRFDIAKALFSLYSTADNSLVNHVEKERFVFNGSVPISPCIKLEGNAYVSWIKNMEIDYDVYFKISSVRTDVQTTAEQLAEAVTRNWKHFVYVSEGLFKTEGKLYVTSGIETFAGVSRDAIPHCVAHVGSRHKRELAPINLCRCLKCLTR